MSAPQTTPLSELLGNKNPQEPPGPPPQQAMPHPPADPSAQFGQMPGQNGPSAQLKEETQPITNQMPGGPGQGVSAPKREMFGNLKEDWKDIILVFAIILILSSGIFYSVLRPYIPGSVGPDGKVTLVGSLIAAVVGVIIYVVVKAIGKF